MAQKFLCVYHDMIPTLEKLQPAEIGRLLLAALKYDAAGEQPVSLPGKEDLIWPMIMAQIDRANASYEAKCETNRRNISKRYDRIRSNTTVYDGNQYNKNTTQEEDKKNTTQEKKADAFREFAGEDLRLLRALREFSEMRTRIKAPLTDAAKSRLLSKLSKFPADQRAAILDQSVDNCWKGIYPLGKAGPEKVTNNIFAEIGIEEGYF